MIILQQYPDDFELFHKIKDDILLYNDYENLKIKCFSCGSCGHIVKICPLMYIIKLNRHYKIDNEKVIK